jgi:hypothetical protein
MESTGEQWLMLVAQAYYARRFVGKTGEVSVSNNGVVLLAEWRYSPLKIYKRYLETFSMDFTTITWVFAPNSSCHHRNVPKGQQAGR